MPRVRNRNFKSNQRVALRPSSFSPCGRRWRDANTVSSATDEGSASAARTPHPPSLRRSRCKASASPFKKDGGRRPPMHPLPQGERGFTAVAVRGRIRGSPGHYELRKTGHLSAMTFLRIVIPLYLFV